MAANVAAEFSTSTAYAIGDLVLRDGYLYKFTSAHTAGAWNWNQVSAVDDLMEQKLERILAGKDAAEKASDYADTVVFSPTQMTGTRYKYVLTNAPDPRQ